MVAKKYHAGKGIVGYVAISVLFIGLIFKYRLGMLALEKTKTLMIVIIASGLINIILNMILIPSQGIMGAAIATMISFCIYFLLMLVISKKIFAWTFPMISLLRTTAAAAAVIYPLSMIMETNGNIFRLLTAGVTSLLAYALLLCACNEVKLTEIKSLYELLIAKSKQLKACRVSADR
jgi:O-antigen/teichoic acid export membrane protein